MIVDINKWWSYQYTIGKWSYHKSSCAINCTVWQVKYTIVYLAEFYITEINSSNCCTPATFLRPSQHQPPPSIPLCFPSCCLDRRRCYNWRDAAWQGHTRLGSPQLIAQWAEMRGGIYLNMIYKSISILLNNTIYHYRYKMVLLHHVVSNSA